MTRFETRDLPNPKLLHPRVQILKNFVYDSTIYLIESSEDAGKKGQTKSIIEKVRWSIFRS